MAAAHEREDDPWGEPPEYRRDRLAAAFVTSLVAWTLDVPMREMAARRRSTAAASRGRQVAIYLAHVTLAWSMSRVATAFGRDRTTASHAIHVVEDLRDDAAFDALLTALEASIRHACEAPAAA
ncbi:helix-turn-helix domain-containing protein [Caulobacter mirabilis]|uniref:Chromosomal replication initiator DnaA n=1 Tax=Caulobacter mirabilis TaxID=69666 RepID=A0A2D2AVD7_9CAUL|nr:helix-turn-helix domain-containing protein [Caulobacter mirabilis]ATQ41963.1 chromosomal replication initiator DnaA [Caulobacter mirabilis]